MKLKHGSRRLLALIALAVALVSTSLVVASPAHAACTSNAKSFSVSTPEAKADGTLYKCNGKYRVKGTVYDLKSDSRSAVAEFQFGRTYGYEYKQFKATNGKGSKATFDHTRPKDGDRYVKLCVNAQNFWGGSTPKCQTIS